MLRSCSSEMASGSADVRLVAGHCRLTIDLVAEDQERRLGQLFHRELDRLVRLTPVRGIPGRRAPPLPRGTARGPSSRRGTLAC
jgi:hypothetical protein